MSVTTLLGRLRIRITIRVKKLIKELPPKVSVQFVGPKPYHEIEKQFAHSSLFISTSKNENYGHSIIEALGNGIPVLVSKACPWNQLNHIMRDIDYLLKNLFLEKLTEFKLMSSKEKVNLRRELQHIIKNLQILIILKIVILSFLKIKLEVENRFKYI